MALDGTNRLPDVDQLEVGDVLVIARRQVAAPAPVEAPPVPPWLPPLALFVAWLLLVFLTRRSYRMRSTVVVAYDLEEEAAASYERLYAAVWSIGRAKVLEAVDTSTYVHDRTTWKRHAGADWLYEGEPLQPFESAPFGMATNVSVPALRAGPRTLYFLPDRLLVQHRLLLASVDYSHLDLSLQHRNNIRERAPSDAEVVRYTWKHPNKDGSADRRFRSNYQIPVCRFHSCELVAHGIVRMRMYGSSPTTFDYLPGALEQHAWVVNHGVGEENP